MTQTCNSLQCNADVGDGINNSTKRVLRGLASLIVVTCCLPRLLPLLRTLPVLGIVTPLTTCGV